MVETYLAFWLITAMIIIAVIVFWSGLTYNKDNELKVEAYVVGAIFWPIVLIISPFIGLYYLGKYLRNKNSKE